MPGDRAESPGVEFSCDERPFISLTPSSLLFASSHSPRGLIGGLSQEGDGTSWNCKQHKAVHLLTSHFPSKKTLIRLPLIM